MATSNVQEEVQRILDEACNPEKNGAPGLVFGMMDRNGNYLAKAAAGVRGLNRKDEKMTTDTAFAIYSCTKVSSFDPFIATSGRRLIHNASLC